MRRLVQVAFLLTVALAAIRSALYLANAAVLFRDPLEAFYLESKFVHLCWRVQDGEALYPDFRIEPYVANFFSPLYFLVVGAIGRLLDADLDGLTRIGRATTIGSAVVASAVVGVAAGRRYGRGAGLIAALIGLSSAPLMNFGAMARPDLLADTLGFAGFLAAIGRRPRWQVIGGALLVASAMTKQTMGVYLIAAVAGLALEGRGRASAGLLVGATAALGACFGLLTLRCGERFVFSMIGEFQTQSSNVYWNFTLSGLLERAPELPFFAAVGLALWTLCRPREPALAALAVAVPLVAVVTAAKMGSDLNYFLGLRLVAALGAGALWGRLLRGEGDAGRPPRWLLAVAIVGSGLLVPGLRDAAQILEASRDEARFFASDRGRATLEAYRHLFRMAEDPDCLILTDSGPILLRMRSRAPFADPWLFRQMTIQGRIRPGDLRQKIDLGEYEAIITISGLGHRDALTHPFLLPPNLILEAADDYMPAFAIAPDDERFSLFVYVPRVSRGEPSEALEAARRLAPETARPSSADGPE